MSDPKVDEILKQVAEEFKKITSEYIGAKTQTKARMTGKDTCTIEIQWPVPTPYIEVTLTLSSGPKCPLCGHPAELLLTYHCTNEECQNYDAKLLEPCETAGAKEFDTEEDTLRLWPEEDDWWPSS